MSHLKASSVARSAPSPTPSNTSTGAAKRKRADDVAPATVYSQPQETGTGSHIYTQLTYTVEHLRNNQRWMGFEDIMAYLNIPRHDEHTRTQLQHLYRSENPQNRIEYNSKDNTYRYKPKYDIRDAAQLKGYFQNQKSAQGLSVKDLKDGWSTVQDDLKAMEVKGDILVKRNQKDQQARTVWDNDPSLGHVMDAEFANEWHKIPIPANPDDLRNSLIAAGLKPSSAAREPTTTQTKTKRKKAARRGGKQTNTHMTNILKDFSHMRK